MGNVIGTLSEKSIHATLKDILEPNKEYQEVPVGRYIADIRNDRGIIEIQTQQFKNLLGKLNYYNNQGIDTVVVYPLIHVKYINWIDVDSMEVVERRKSSHTGVIQDVFKELYWIIDYIVKEKIEFKIVLIDVEEYKHLDGRGQNSKIKATKIDKVPTKIVGEISFCSISDLKKFIPSTLDKNWTSKEYKKATKSNKKYLGSGLKMLRELGVIQVVGKSGNSFVYSMEDK